MALIEIEGLPIQNGGPFHGELLNNQRVHGFTLGGSCSACFP